MRVDVQKFMELRDSARARQSIGKDSAKTAEKGDWRALLDSKRKEIGLEPAAPTRANNKTAQVSAIKAENRNRAVAADFDGTMEERVGALRERSAEGLPVRELGNFIDVRA
ncbi:MAG: hypothetical protein LBH25_01285 [Fibromonadaceae bacterium]|jgi:hypothetical protein|nr:hypothetical protein [Fibromonadaceae bacterium]